MFFSHVLDIISDICEKMGNGMADFIDTNTVDTIKDYELYCHYVAGLVGLGLTALFNASGLEDDRFSGIDEYVFVAFVAPRFTLD